ncbi:MAG: SurA N-terminal domain-containing protein [Candidatus Omnitrophota bacterium]
MRSFIMKKIIFYLIIIFVICGCQPKKDTSPVLAKINNYEITAAEFEREFRDSNFAKNNTLESRKEFLNYLIDRKVILQDAQKKGLDKEDAFLESVERFWEQSLLKSALEREAKKLAGRAVVNDETIKKAYEEMFKEGQTDKTYEQMYEQIKREITKRKEAQLMNEWLVQLRKNTTVEINYAELKNNNK